MTKYYVAIGGDKQGILAPWATGHLVEEDGHCYCPACEQVIQEQDEDEYYCAYEGPMPFKHFDERSLYDVK